MSSRLGSWILIPWSFVVVFVSWQRPQDTKKKEVQTQVKQINHSEDFDPVSFFVRKENKFEFGQITFLPLRKRVQGPTRTVHVNTWCTHALHTLSHSPSLTLSHSCRRLREKIVWWTRVQRLQRRVSWTASINRRNGIDSWILRGFSFQEIVQHRTPMPSSTGTAAATSWPRRWWQAKLCASSSPFRSPRGSAARAEILRRGIETHRNTRKFNCSTADYSSRLHAIYYLCIYIYSIYVYIYIYVWYTHAYVHICMSVWMHKCTHDHAWLFVYMSMLSMCMCIYIYICMSARM